MRGFPRMVYPTDDLIVRARLLTRAVREKSATTAELRERMSRLISELEARLQEMRKEIERRER